MNNESLAPCGVICELCVGYQRAENKCVGCNNTGSKPYHCTVCSITLCAEKKENSRLLCFECIKFPCRRIKDLNKRYIGKYGMSPIQNLKRAKEIGIKQFIFQESEKWKCSACGQYLCVHKELCLSCGNKNQYFPQKNN